MIDTNVISEFTRKSPNERVVTWLRAQTPKDVFISAVTWMELRLGIELLANGTFRLRLTQWLENDLASMFDGRIVPMNMDVADMAARILAAARRDGHTQDTSDVMIAATALVHDLTVVTRNARHFEPLGVRVFDPWVSA